MRTYIKHARLVRCYFKKDTTPSLFLPIKYRSYSLKLSLYPMNMSSSVTCPVKSVFILSISTSLESLKSEFSGALENSSLIAMIDS